MFITDAPKTEAPEVMESEEPEEIIEFAKRFISPDISRSLVTW